MKYVSIFSVALKSAITPSFIGLMATMFPGVRPSISFASLPTASTSPVFLLMATIEGSFTTMPLPLAYTNVLAVPRSMARSLENMLKSERRLWMREFSDLKPFFDIPDSFFYLLTSRTRPPDRLLPIHHHVSVWFSMPSHFNHVPHLHKISYFQRQGACALGHHRKLIRFAFNGLFAVMPNRADLPP